jgi:WhiB family redox-sensing transcriptional regulator
VQEISLSPGVWIYRYERQVERRSLGFSPNWHQDALCSGMDDAIFFGTENYDKRPPLSLTEVRAAREICDQCPVARECLTHALTLPEQYGIWAGTSGNMREKMVKQINKGVDIEVVVDKYLEEA